MNALDIIKYGNKDIEEAIKDLNPSIIDIPGVTTHWSIKDAIAHLASYEHLLEDVLNFVVDPTRPRPFLDHMSSSGATFNDDYVAEYKSKSFDEVVGDYKQTYLRVAEIASKISPEKFRETGTIPWYGLEYSLDDFIVYASYGHKREHAGEIKQFLKRTQK
jgi:hypothetical protein